MASLYQGGAQIPHGGGLRLSGQELIFSETAVTDWQLIRILSQHIYLYRAVINLRVRALAGQRRYLYFGHVGGIHLGYVELNSENSYCRQAESVQCRLEGDVMNIEVVYQSNSNEVYFGSALDVDVPIYAGGTEDVFSIQSCEISRAYRPAGTKPEITIVDIGAANGLQPKWDVYAADITAIFVEPEKEAAEKLRAITGHVKESIIVAHALSDNSNYETLNITRFRECSSILEPNFEILKNWNVAPLFEVEGRQQVRCQPYKDIHLKSNLPIPDFIKIDVQGFELRVLQGFDDLLHQCLGIELESHFYEIYKDQSLITDVVEYLYNFGLFLREIRPCRSFDNDLVEIDAFFTRKPQESDDDRKRAKLSFIEEVLDLRHYDLGRRLIFG